MGILSNLRAALALPALAAQGVPEASPYAWPNHLYTVDTSELPERLELTRLAAIRVPAVKRARGLIVGSIARCPLVAYTGETRAAVQPAWTDRTDGPVSPYHRMLWTIDDLIFYGSSLWAVERDEAGTVTAADRVPWEHWGIGPDGRVLYHGVPVPDDSVCLIPGIDAGLLVDGVDAIHHATVVNRSAARAANNPSAQIELHQTQGEPMTEPAIDSMIGRWAKARRGDNGGVAYTNPSIEVREHGAANEHLLIEGRNAASVDVARAVGIQASLIDATVTESSMDYSNVEARNAEFVDLALAPYMSAVAARLGMDDMVPAAQSVEFDLTPLSSLSPHSVGVPDDDAPPARPRLGVAQ